MQPASALCEDGRSAAKRNSIERILRSQASDRKRAISAVKRPAIVLSGTCSRRDPSAGCSNFKRSFRQTLFQPRPSFAESTISSAFAPTARRAHPPKGVLHAHKATTARRRPFPVHRRKKRSRAAVRNRVGVFGDSRSRHLFSLRIDRARSPWRFWSTSFFGRSLRRRQKKDGFCPCARNRRLVFRFSPSNWVIPSMAHSCRASFLTGTSKAPAIQFEQSAIVHHSFRKSSVLAWPTAVTQGDVVRRLGNFRTTTG